MSRIFVTGGTGFLGHYVIHELKKNKEHQVFLCNHIPGFDLTNRAQTVQIISHIKPDTVFHLAGFNGGIEFNYRYPADIFIRNTQMATNVLEACYIAGVKKVISVVASCAYPSELPFASGNVLDTCLNDVLDEKDFLNGLPHKSVACHGYAKRNLQLVSYFMRKQYGLNAVCACPTTLYGPGDSVDPLKTKVMMGLVMKFVDAVDNKQEKVTLWGTGKAHREFLYVHDAAKLLIHTWKYYNDSSKPINLGSGQEYSIKELAEIIARLTGFTGEICWDDSKPDGQLRKRLVIDMQNSLFPDIEFTPIEQGIRETISDYRSLKNENRGSCQQSWSDTVCI